MHAVVYVLRRSGEKLPPDVVKSRPYVGWLHWGQDSRKYYPQEAVRLFQRQGTEMDVVEPLAHPIMRKIDRGGMLITGTEEVRNSITQRQAWWVVPGPLDDLSSPP